MPIFDIESEDGRKISLEGDVAPSPDEIDEIFAGIPKKQETPERKIIPPIGREPFGSPPVQMEKTGAFSPEVVGVFGGNRPKPTPEAMAALESPASYINTAVTGIGRPVNAALQDVGASIALTPEQGGNLYELATREEPFYSPKQLPYQRTLADISRSNPAVATVGKIAAGVTESAPLMAAFPTGVLGKIAAAGFAVDMAASGGTAAGTLYEELQKPEKDRDYNLITDSLSSLIQSGVLAPAAGVHAGSIAKTPRQLAIRELARQLKNEPIKSDVDTAANIRLGTQSAPIGNQRIGVRMPEDIVNPLAEKEVAPIVQQAFDEAKARGAENPARPMAGGVSVPPIFSAAERLKRERQQREYNPPLIIPEARVQKPVEGGKLGRQAPAEVQNAAALLEDMANRKPEAVTETGEPQGPPRPEQPLRTMAEIIEDRLKKRDFVAAVDVLSKQPAEVQRKVLDNTIGVKRATVGLSAAEQTIFNELWDKVYQDSLKKGAKNAIVQPKVERLRQQERPGTDELGKAAETSSSNRPVESGEGSKEAQGPVSFFDRQSEMEGLGRMSTAPTLEDIRAQRAAEAKQNKPEVAKLDTNVDKNKFGDPRGTTYHATPEDWAAWQEVQKQPVMESFAERERIKNKYGGMPPEPPKESSAQPRQGTSSQPSSLLAGEQTKAAETPAAVSDAIQSGIQAIESLQKKIRGSGKLQMGVPSAILDTALEAARLSLKAGKSVAEAIEAALKHIRYNLRKGDWNEAKVKAMLEKELSGAAAKPVVPVQAANPTATKTADVAAPNRAVEETLAKVQQVFEPKPKQKTPVSVKASNVVEAVRTGLSSKFRPVNWMEEMVAKANPSYKPKDIAGIMEQLKGSQGKGEADVYRFDRDVSKLVSGSEKDFSEYVFMRRTLDRLKQDAADINRAIAGEEVPVLNRRSVSDFTINELEPALKAFEQKLGPEKLKKFQEAADQYQRHMDNALRLQVESGRMSPEIYDAIKSGNEFYAPFKVMKYLEESSRPEGSGRKIDTVADYTKAMKGIEDRDFRLGDMLAAGRQNILMSRILADKNTAMRAVAEIAPYDIEGRFIKKLKPSEEAPLGMAAVNVLEGGKKQRYAVDTKVAEAIQLYGGNAAGVLSRMLGYASIPFRAGATALNLPFQVSNLLADVPRQAFVSKYGLTGAQDFVRFPLDFVHSLYSSITGDVFGKKNKLFLDFLDSGVAGTTIQEYLTPEALKFKEPTAISRSKKLASSVLNVIPDFAKAIEQTSKIMGVKRAMRMEGVESGKQLAKQIPEAITELRRFSGSPDFGRQGKAIEAARLNLIYMFLNARIQGAIADVGRLAGRDGGKQAAVTWLRIASAVGIPTAYLWYLNNKEGNKEDYESRPIQERQNYWLIPKEDENGKPRYITTEEGEKIRDYWRVPKRESSKWIANLTESALQFAKTRNPKSAADFGNQMIQELSPVNLQGDTAQERLESVASSLNPLIKAPLEMATGRDLYRHQPIMSDRLKQASPEEQYKERTPEAFKKLAVAMPDVSPEIIRSPIMLENLTRNLTAGLVTQFLPRKDVQGRSKLENNPLLQRFQSLPMTDNSEFQENVKGLERQAVDEQLNRHRKALEAMEKNPNAQLPNLIASVLPKDKSKITSDDVKLMEHLTDLWVAKQNGATFKDRQVMALPARQRALWVQQQLGGLTPQKKAEKILELARKRIFTESVAAELVNLEQEKEK